MRLDLDILGFEPPARTAISCSSPYGAIVESQLTAEAKRSREARCGCYACRASAAGRSSRRRCGGRPMRPIVDAVPCDPHQGSARDRRALTPRHHCARRGGSRPPRTRGVATARRNSDLKPGSRRPVRLPALADDSAVRSMPSAAAGNLFRARAEEDTGAILPARWNAVAGNRARRA